MDVKAFDAKLMFQQLVQNIFFLNVIFRFAVISVIEKRSNIHPSLTLSAREHTLDIRF